MADTHNEIEVIFSHYTNMEWDCRCGHHNIDEEGQLFYKTGDFAPCLRCGTQYVFVESGTSKSKLSLVDDVED